MKKILLFSIFLICSEALAQPSINSSDFDNLNISYAIKRVTSAILNEGAEGAGITWDFSSMALSYDPQDGIQTVMQVQSGPFSSSFPNANYVFKSFSSSNSSEDFYSYFNKTNTILEELASSSSSSIDYFYINPYTTFIFPLTYGTISSDTSQENGQNTVYTETKTYDAYGTLITPFGTFNNVIRIKTVQNDSTDFEWYETTPFRPLLNVFQSFNGDREFIFYEPNTLTTESFNQKSIYFFTSSTNNSLNIVTDNSMQISHLNIIDLTGKKIIQQFGNSNSINIEGLSSGIYLVQVNSNKGIFTQKFVKK